MGDIETVVELDLPKGTAKKFLAQAGEALGFTVVSALGAEQVIEFSVPHQKRDSDEGFF